jgi:hypothetical protein
MYNCIERILANSYKCEGFLGIYSKEISGHWSKICIEDHAKSNATSVFFDRRE